MPVNKKQVMRLIKFVAELRRNAYPNATTFVHMLEEVELSENLNIACTVRTIMRDIDTLKRDFNAPIKFSAELNGYFLDNPYWELQLPVMEEDMLMSSMLGARLAQDIMPSPIKEKIRNAVDNELANNNSEFLDRAFLESLLIASGAKTTVAPEVFEQVFLAWRQRRLLHIQYRKSTGELSGRDVEPHVIAYHKGNWYLKGVDYPEKKIAVFAIHRILSAEILKRGFDIRRDIVEDTQKNGLFDYPKIEQITVKCAKEIAYYLREQKRAKKLIITDNPDGSLTVILPPSPEHEVIRWILGEGGNVEVIAPLWLRQKVYQAAIKIAQINNKPVLN